MKTASNPLLGTPSRAGSSVVVDDTPLRSNSSAVRLYPKPSASASRISASDARSSPSNPGGASKSTRTVMDNLLRRELGDGVVRDLPAFVDRFFPPSDATADVYAYALRAGLYDGLTARWARWPQPASERGVLSFFQDVVDNHLLQRFASSTSDSGSGVYRYVPSNETPLRNGDCMRKTDLLLTTQVPPGDRVDFAALRPNRYDWRSVRVVGELKRNPTKSDDESTLLQVANYAREVFGAQPCRRSVHAFTLCGHYLRAWLFDRSGAIGSTLVDIHAQPVLFLRIICGYASMDATQLGFDPSIKWDRGEETVYDPTVALEIKTEPIFSRHAIVTRGSACWKARLYEAAPTSEWMYAVKDQWRASERDSECGIISSMMREDGIDQIVGLPRYVCFDEFREDGKLVDIASTVRRDLVSAKRKRRATEPAATGEMPPPPKRRSVSAAPAWSASHNVSSSRKRKFSDALPASSSHSKKIKIGSSVPAANPVVAAADPASLPKCNNRIFSRLVMTPIGKGLEKFSSYTELLAALRDAIRGHQHLYQKHHILHRDVSVHNILISPPGHPSAGVLIDLDLAINTNRAANSGASHRTGTPDFMALGVLEGEPHRACHDLESFFFVLLWLATFYDADGNRRPEVTGSLFQACNTQFAGGGDFEDVAMVKGAYVTAEKFERKTLARLEDDARTALGPLLSDWRDLLFTAPDEPRLWDDMHAAIVRRLAELNAEEQAAAVQFTP
ncbi:hypothetical protein FN846DRAFT_819189 [Sphaerosporella brunnea]|uniref:non-specific serine/threonine protein kinase n=1 Tax=Sphaerosporella brunnea TaxID=1250544 RepID=A0A5J5EI19_9PEZI|nr:hypothetical protein FN846DRAFT_819189 [Sphaerosporella brunnea]